jgi:uncharacterized protein YjbJ (UPF0337 family)
MNREHAQGAMDKAKGAIKEAIGKQTHDKELRTQGKMDKAKGEARQALGDAEEAMKETAHLSWHR